MIVNAAKLIPNKNQGIPGWMLNSFFRLFAYLVIISTGLFFAIFLVNQFLPISGSDHAIAGSLISNLTQTAILLGLYHLLITKLEQRPVYEFSGTSVFTELAAGLIIGVSLIATIILLMAVLGFYSIISFNALSALLNGFITFGYGAFFEELVFRLIIFKLLEEYFGSWISMTLSAMLFGAAHAFNDHASLWSAFAIATEAGVLLSVAFIFTRRIWMVMGIHFSWNFMQASVFGLPASGMEFPGLITAELSGPAWLTGGSFGIEASPFTVIFGLLISLFLLKKAFADDQLILPLWHKKKKTEIRY